MFLAEESRLEVVSLAEVVFVGDGSAARRRPNRNLQHDVSEVAWEAGPCGPIETMVFGTGCAGCAGFRLGGRVCGNFMHEGCMSLESVEHATNDSKVAARASSVWEGVYIENASHKASTNLNQSIHTGQLPIP